MECFNCLQSTKANGMKTSFEACRQEVLLMLNDYSIAWHGYMLYGVCITRKIVKKNQKEKSENTRYLIQPSKAKTCLLIKLMTVEPIMIDFSQYRRIRNDVVESGEK